MPAYNEEGNIEDALRAVTGILEEALSDYEIIVVDDGSQDRTALLAQRLAVGNPKIKVTSNGENKGYGYTFKRGLHLARKSYVTIFPGDNDMSADILKNLIREIDQREELILTYPSCVHNRSLFRRLVSKSFVVFMNGVFGLRLKYYNGAFICETKRVQSLPLKSGGLTVLAECIVRLIQSGCRYKSIPFVHTGRKSHQSKAFTFKNIRAVTKFIFILIGDIYFAGNTSKRALSFRKKWPL